MSQVQALLTDHISAHDRSKCILEMAVKAHKNWDRAKDNLARWRKAGAFSTLRYMHRECELELDILNKRNVLDRVLRMHSTSMRKVLEANMKMLTANTTEKFKAHLYQ